MHRFILIKCEDSFHYLFSVYHHIITDGWGTSLMFQRFINNYNELVEFNEVKSVYPYSYKEFSCDDSFYINSENYSNDEEYWKKKFSNIPYRLFERKEEHLIEANSNRQSLIVPRALYDKLINISLKFKCSTFHVILAVIYLYFGRKHQNTDFAVGIPVLNRSTAKFKRTVGLFMGISLLRIKLDFNNTFSDLLINIKQALRQDYRHQRFPLGKLMQSLDVFPDLGQLFNITLSYEKQDYSTHFYNTVTDVIPLTHQSERVALALYVREFSESEDVSIDFDYNLGYFDYTDILEIISHFENLLVSICAEPQMRLIDYEYLSLKDLQVLTRDFNNTQFDYDPGITLIQLFNEGVLKHPLHLALCDDQISYSYQELDILSNKIADYIIKRYGKTDKSPIAVLMNRSTNLIVVLLAVLKTGRAYIPLDPNFPKARLEYIVQHSGIKIFIGANELRSIIASDATFLVFNEVITSSLLKTNFLSVEPADTAYIIYTSGSTGTPKGVEISHKSLLNLLLSIHRKPGLKYGDTFFSVTTQSFDISVLEFFAPLISGSTVYVARKELLSDTFATIKKLYEVQPTMIQATPSFYQMLFSTGWIGNPKLKVLCGGDTLSQSLASKLIDTCCEVWNMYGPTETTIWSSMKKIIHAYDASIIGSPIDNTSLYILDNGLKLLPIGYTGNIYIGGNGLAKGYFNNELLTNERFIDSPFDEGKKIYNTGDLGRWNRNGEVEFIGRDDNQVKIRGYRIELGEIETKINQLTSVASSVVVTNKSFDQEATLIAYIIPKTATFNVSLALEYLRVELPEYMVPHAIVVIDKFPFTPNNKIDRKELSLRKVEYVKQKPFSVAAVTLLEKKLCELYRQALLFEGIIGITDNFFALGGHSLNAVRLINSINKELFCQVTLRDLMQNPSIEMLSKVLANKATNLNKAIGLISEMPDYRTSTAQENIWLTSHISQTSSAYNMFAAFEIQGDLNLEMLTYSFNHIIRKYEVLRSNFIESYGTVKLIFKKADDINFKVDTHFTSSLEFENTVAEFANKPFNLDHDLILKARLFKIDDNRCFLVFVTHHVLMDGWSLGLLINEIVNSYSRRDTISKSQLRFQYKDYIAWHHNECLKSEAINQRFWKDYLSGYEWIPILPKDQRNKIDPYKAAVFTFKWDKQFVSDMSAMAQRHSVTLHTYLVAAFNVLLYRMFLRNDICIGTVNSGRNSLDLQEQIGMFVKTLPLRTTITTGATFSDILNSTNESLLLLDEHQDIPSVINSKVLLEVLFVLQDPLVDYNTILVDDNLKLIKYPIEAYYSRLPLLVNLVQSEGTIQGEVHFNISNYSQENIEILFSKYEVALRTLLIDKCDSIDNLDIRLNFEKATVIDINLDF